MKSSTKDIIVWTPRVICIIFAFFMTLFAFDVFNNDASFMKLLLDFFIHMLPVIFLVVLLIISWKIPWVGAIAFNATGLAYVILYWGKFPFVTYLGIVGPMFVVGIFFALNWMLRNEINDH